MNLYKSFFVFSLSFLFLVPLFSGKGGKTSSEETPLPTCTSTGTLGCPKGFVATCPEKQKPSCIFIGKGQLPACLDDGSKEVGRYEYYLDRIKCEKQGASKKK